MIDYLAQTLGVVGVLLVIIAYLYLQLGKWGAHDLLYPLFNFLGGAAILVSLFFAWNLASFLMEFTWVLISLFGVYQSLRLRAKGA